MRTIYEIKNFRWVYCFTEQQELQPFYKLNLLDIKGQYKLSSTVSVEYVFISTTRAVA